jgi:hypothetical protein
MNMALTLLTLTSLTAILRSMATMVDDLLARVAVEAHRDPDGVRPVLQVLVGDEPEVGRGRLRPVASRLNDARLAAAHDEFRAGALTTDDVRRRLELGSRQAVHALRDRGRLVGRTSGNATLFPAWQFDGPRLRGDLSALLKALRRFTTDAVACDRVMRLPRAELDGASLAESLDDPGRRELAWALLDRLGEP